MHRIGLLAALWASGCMPQLDDCVDDDGCPAARTCQQGYCLPVQPRLNDASMRDLGVDARRPDVVGSDPCNGIDDDNDGLTDEDFRPAECFVGVGRCSVRGADVCVDGDVVCDATPDAAQMQAETCNGVDDDCDGSIDEAGPENLCCPVAETCNGVDDDCDLRVDELPLIGPALNIAQHAAGAARVLRIAATGTHVGVLTHDMPSGRARLLVYDLAELNAPPISMGLDLDDGLSTQMIAHGDAFIIGAAGTRAGVDLARITVTAGELVAEYSSAPLLGRPDQMVLQGYADGRTAVVAHGSARTDYLFWFTVPADFGVVPRGIDIEAAGYATGGGFAAGLWGELLQVVWTAAGLHARTITGLGQVQTPLENFGALATRPFMAGLGVADGDPILLWQTHLGVESADLAARKLAGGQQGIIAPVRGDRPTGTPVDDSRLLVGWRERGTLEGRVGLLRVAEQTFQLDGQLSTGSARRAPAMAVSGSTVSVAWLAENAAVYLQHHQLACPAQQPIE